MGKFSKKTSLVVGIDLGDTYSYLCCLDPDTGEVVKEDRVKTTVSGFRKWFSGKVVHRVALEVGTHSPWVSRLLTDLGHEVLVANARNLRLLSRSSRKDDRTDAEKLARIARVDPQLLSPIQHRSASGQAHLAILRARETLIKSRTQLVNHCRGAVKSVGQRLSGCSSGSFAVRAMSELPDELRPALVPILETILHLTEQIRSYNRQLRELTHHYPETARLQQIRGVGILTSLAYVLLLEDPQRFPKSRTVGAYLGLVPARQNSGSLKPQLRITKEGDAFLRKLLVGCAQYILGPFGQPCALRDHGLKIAERGGKNAKRRAVVAVARKLAVVLLRLFVTGDEYQPYPGKHLAEAI